MSDRAVHQSDQYERRKVMRKARKQLKRNRGRKRVREKTWAQYDIEAYEDMDSASEEPVMPRGERERKKAVPGAIKEQLETERLSTVPSEDWCQGVVVRMSSGMYQVESRGREFICTVRGSLTAYNTGYTNVVAVGDSVFFSPSTPEQGTIERVQPRRTYLWRPDVFYSHLRQVIVANVDQLLIITSVREPAIWFELIDRYLVAAACQGLKPIICLNKTDLASDDEECQQIMQPYLSLGYQLLCTSAVTGEGIVQLRTTLRDTGTVLAGRSGVGKSSLLNAVQPGLHLKTGVVSGRTREGRHTTVQVSLIRLEMGGYVVDTPGIREFGLGDISQEELVTHFPEIAERAPDCRFPGCSHILEPDCAVRDAVHSGDIAASRYDSYVKILR